MSDKQAAAGDCMKQGVTKILHELSHAQPLGSVVHLRGTMVVQLDDTSEIKLSFKQQCRIISDKESASGSMNVTYVTHEKKPKKLPLKAKKLKSKTKSTKASPKVSVGSPTFTCDTLGRPTASAQPPKASQTNVKRPTTDLDKFFDEIDKLLGDTNEKPQSSTVMNSAGAEPFSSPIASTSTSPSAKVVKPPVPVDLHEADNSIITSTVKLDEPTAEITPKKRQATAAEPSNPDPKKRKCELKCDYCKPETNYPTKNAREVHIAEAHPELDANIEGTQQDNQEVVKKLQCYFCQKGYMKREALRKHISQKHHTVH